MHLALSIGLRPLRSVDIRLPWVERFLELALTDEDVAAIRASGGDAPARLGMYYHWYLQKALVARFARTASPGAMQRLLARLDRSDYTSLIRQLEPANGLLICIPHHGHYAVTMLGLIQRLRDRETLVFYASPTRRSGNAVFDALHRRMFDGIPSVRVVHDTAKGMAEVLRGLRRGAVVLLMPDAVQATASPFFVTFAGRQLPVMLGPAVLARKTDATVLVAVSRVESSGTTFRTQFSVPRRRGAGDDTLVGDYRFVAALFRDIESLISGQFLYWQHVRAHFSHAVTLPVVDPAEIRLLFRPFLRDPRIRSVVRPAISLD